MNIAIFIICLFLSFPLVGVEVENALDSIPARDRQKIDHLFSYLIQRESVGYVLFGSSKPAAICTIPIHCKYALVSPSISNRPLRYQTNIKQGWEVWKKYVHKFKHPNIIVCEEHNCFKKSAFLNLFFIHRQRFLALLEEYKDEFIEVLGEEFSPSEFVNSVAKRRKLRPLIRHDEKLLGLILGFGLESSSAYKKMDLGFELDPPVGKAGFRPKGCIITPVSFRGNIASLEVKKLIDNYTEESLQIEQIYKSENFLLQTLQALCSSE